MTNLATRSRRAPDSGRFDADAAIRLALIALGRDPMPHAHRVRADHPQGIVRRRHRPVRSANARLGDPFSDRRIDLPCQRYDPDLWFADAPADLEHAKALCADCPVQQACLLGALDRNETAGVWGGHIFDHGQIVTYKRPRGRPAKHAVAPERYPA